MRKALVILGSNKNDKCAWSGTNYHITHALEQHFESEYYRFVDESRLLRKLVQLYYGFLRRVFGINRTIMPYWYLRHTSRKAAKTVDRSPAEYVFTTNSHLVPFLLKSGKKIVYISDAVFHSMIDYYWFNYDKRDFAVFDKLQRQTLQGSYLNFLASQWAVDSSIGYYKSNPRTTICLPFGANLPECAAIDRHLKSDKVTVLFCGVDRVRKGLDIAVNTIHELNARHKKAFRLEVLGLEGTSHDDIVFHGRKNKNDKADLAYIENLYRGADLFLLPTKAECAGIVFCEAAMFSLPIVSHNTGGVPTYVKDGYNGILLEIGSNASDFADAVERIIRDSETYEIYSKNSRDYYESDLSWKKWGEHIATILDN